MRKKSTFWTVIATISVTLFSWNILRGVLVVATIASAVAIPALGDIAIDPDLLGYTDVNSDPANTTGSDDLHVGNTSMGEVLVDGGSDVLSDYGLLGDQSTGIGYFTVNGSGSTWTNSSSLSVGYEGTGTLNITGGGQVNNDYGYVGHWTGSTGVVTVDGGVGLNSAVTVNGAGYSLLLSGIDLFVNDFSVDTLGPFNWGDTLNVTADVKNGGDTASGNFDVQFFLSNDVLPDATDTILHTLQLNSLDGNAVVLNNAEITLPVTGTFLDGDYFLAVIVDPANVVVEFDEINNVFMVPLFIGSGSTESGSTWTNSKGLTVGSSGNGTLDIIGGGQVSNTAGHVGRTSGSMGAVTVDGDGSAWTNSDDLYVGNFGDGRLNITDGGLVSVTGILTIDHDEDGNGFINMASGGMLALNGDAADSLASFLGLINGTDAIRYWDNSIASWADISGATEGLDYTLTFLVDGDLAGYTALTVTVVPDPFCGDAAHPYPAGDHSEDCRVDYVDFGMVSQGWQAAYDLASLLEVAGNWLDCNDPRDCS